MRIAVHIFAMDIHSYLIWIYTIQKDANLHTLSYLKCYSVLPPTL